MLCKWLPFAITTESISPYTISTMTSAPNGQIDFAILKNIARHPDAQIELLQTFLTHNREDVAALSCALDVAETEQVVRSAHRIKGAARMIGAHSLQQLSASIEQVAQLGDLQQARALAERQLHDIVAATELAISQFIDALRG
jgi:HPt (histidine-containing phosphotransfer) domain-containing protein